MGSHPRPITDLLRQLATQVRRLAVTECEIARAEIGENLSLMRTGVTLLIFATILLIPAITILLAGVALWLARAGVQADLAALTVGVVVLIVSSILALMGVRRMKSAKIVPQKALNQLQRDVAAINPMRQAHEHSAA